MTDTSVIFDSLTATGSAEKMKWVVGDLAVDKKSTDLASHYARLKSGREDFYTKLLVTFTELG